MRAHLGPEPEGIYAGTTLGIGGPPPPNTPPPGYMLLYERCNSHEYLTVARDCACVHGMSSDDHWDQREYKSGLSSLSLRAIRSVRRSKGGGEGSGILHVSKMVV